MPVDKQKITGLQIEGSSRRIVYDSAGDQQEHFKKVMGMTVDIYSLYFAPVGIVTGFLSGLVFQKMSVKKGRIFLAAAVISVPGTIVSALINAVLFGGVTSSGSSILVQMLSKTPLGLTGSIFTVQFLTDYADRCISVFAVSALITAMGGGMVAKLSGRINNNGTI